MKKTIKKLTLIALIAVVATTVITGCKKDKDEVPTPPPPINESEIMTTFLLTFIDSAGVSPTVTAQYRDPDGDGGNPAAQFDTIKLMPNTTYLASVLILDETKNPADTISNEVLEEANDHLFFYSPALVNVTVTILDYDTNTPTPLPLGLQTKWRTMAVSAGTVRIELRHQPEVKDGTYAPGETDVDLTFQLEIQ
jgi:hypothetical protein